MTNAICNDKMKFTLEQLEDLRDEFVPRKKRKLYRCLDKLCGATDCLTCYPDQRENEEPVE